MGKGKGVKGKSKKPLSRKASTGHLDDFLDDPEIINIFTDGEVKLANEILSKRISKHDMLIAATVLGKLRVVQKMVKEGFSLSYTTEDGCDVIHWAIKEHQLACLEWLLQNGTDWFREDHQGNNCLELAVQQASWSEGDFTNLFSQVLSTNTSSKILTHSNKGGHRLIHLVVRRQWEDMLIKLLSLGADVNAVTQKGVTALMMASSVHHHLCVHILLKGNASPHIEDKRGCTALCYAISYMMQKKIIHPSETIKELLSATLKNSNKSIDCYLLRRFQLLLNPPSENLSLIKTHIVVHIITYFMRFVKAGPEKLLNREIFKIVQQALEKHIDNEDYIASVLIALAELMRHCPCCLSHVDESLPAKIFNDTGLPTTCVSIINKYSSEDPQTLNLYLVFLPFLLSCNTTFTKNWLQKNHQLLTKCYVNQVQGKIPQMQFYPNGNHTELVKQSSSDFQMLIDKLENGECISTDNSNNSLNEEFPAIEASINNSLLEENPAAEVTTNNSLNEEYLVPEVSDKSKSLTDIKFSQQSVSCLTLLSKKAIIRTDQKMETEGQGISISKEASKISEIKLHSPQDKSFEYLTDSAMFNERDNDFSMADDEMSSESTDKEDEHFDLLTKLNNSSISFKEEFKEGYELFGIKDDDNPDHDYPFWGLKKQQKNKSIDYATTAEINAFEDNMLKLLSRVIKKYENRWLRDYQSKVQYTGDSNMLFDLIVNLPAIEAHYINTVETKWKYLVESVKRKANVSRHVLQAILNEIQESLSADEEGNEENLIREVLPPQFLSLRPWYEKNVSRTVAPHEQGDFIGNTSVDCNYKLGPDRTVFVLPDHSVCHPSIHTENHSTFFQSKENSTDQTDSKSTPNHIIAHQSTYRRYCEIPVARREVLSSLREIPREKCTIIGNPPLDLTLPPPELKPLYYISSEPGAFGYSYLALEIAGGYAVVVRELPYNCAVPSTVAIVSTLRNVIEPLLQLRHENILPWLHWGLLPTITVLATPLCSTNLSQLLQPKHSDNTYKISIARSLVTQVVKGLFYLHTRQIIHGNIKPSNILVSRDGRLCLSEFGIYEVLYTHNRPLKSAMMWWSQETHDHYKSNCKYFVTAESDIQCCGMVIHYIITGGKHPFGNQYDEIIRSVKAGYPRLRTDHPPATDLVAFMVQHCPDKRPTIEQVKRHLYLWTEKEEQHMISECCGSNGMSLTSDLHQYFDKYYAENNILTDWIKEFYQYGLIGAMSKGGLEENIADDVLKTQNDNENQSNMKSADYKISYLLCLLRELAPNGEPLSQILPHLPLLLYRILSATFWISLFHSNKEEKRPTKVVDQV